VFGVGFFREYYTSRSGRRRRYVANRLPESARQDNGDFENDVRGTRKLVRRAHFLTILSAWVVTVPAAALLAAVIFWGFSLFG